MMFWKLLQLLGILHIDWIQQQFRSRASIRVRTAGGFDYNIHTMLSIRIAHNTHTF